ncbi:MAG: tRNA-dihydrouridine synthase [Oscillospiraceae bacterium]
MFAACPLPVSVKTRLGKATAETFRALLELYNDYPICELIVHPRVQADQYHGHPDLDMFAYALAHSRAPVCYNGDLFDAPAVRAFQARFPTVERVMLGRGLAANPASSASCAPAPCRRRHSFRRFTTGFTTPRARIPDRRALLFRMKEAWRYLGCSFAGAERPLRRIRKAQDLDRV